MGQYHKLVNFTKKEFVESYAFGNGAKLWEQVGWEHAFSNVTHLAYISWSRLFALPVKFQLPLR